MASVIFPGMTITYWEDLDMGLVDDLKAAGYKPEVNSGADFEPLNGVYETVCRVLRTEPGKDGREDQWMIQLYITRVFKGTHVDTQVEEAKRRRLTRWYSKDTDGLKRLVNDCFTAGVTLSLESDEAVEASFEKAIGVTFFVRAWSSTPTKDKEGNVVPEQERRTFQNFVVLTEKDAEKAASKVAKKAGVAPF